MSAIAAIRKLRERTGAGLLECQSALSESGGDLAGAFEVLRVRGFAAAAKKAGRATPEGLVMSYLHPGGKLGVLIEVGCETDFVARNEEFVAFVRELCLQIAGFAPLYVEASEVPTKLAAAKKTELAAAAKATGKTKKLQTQMVEGGLRKWYREICLLEQPLREGSESVAELVAAQIAAMGENIVVRRFARYQIGA